LQAFTVEELWATRGDQDFALTCLLGYVLCVPHNVFFMKTHEGRDLTARQARQWNEISMDYDDDGGAMPLRQPVAEFPDAQLEYVCNWLDHYLGRGVEAVGYLVPFLEQNPSVKDRL